VTKTSSFVDLHDAIYNHLIAYLLSGDKRAALLMIREKFFFLSKFFRDNIYTLKSK